VHFRELKTRTVDIFDAFGLGKSAYHGSKPPISVSKQAIIEAM